MNIMVTDKCNLSCKMCCFANKRSGTELSLNKYCNILDQLIDINIMGKKVTEIRLDGNRESLLHGEIGTLIRESKKRGFKTRLVTNGVLLTEEKSIELIESGLDKLKISITGATSDTYKLYQGYHRPANQFDMVVDNINRFIELKEKYQRNTLVIICYLLTPESVADAFTAFEYWRSKRVDGLFVNKLKKDVVWDEGTKYCCVEKMPHICINSMIITASGEVRPCCNAEHLDFSLGNVFESNLGAILSSNRYYAFVKNVIDGNRLLLPEGCVKCSYLWTGRNNRDECASNFK